MIHLDHILWRLKQLLVNPKRAIVGRFKRAHKIGDLEIWYEPSQFDESKACGFRLETRQPDGSGIVETDDEKGRKVTHRELPFEEV